MFIINLFKIPTLQMNVASVAKASAHCTVFTEYTVCRLRTVRYNALRTLYSMLCIYCSVCTSRKCILLSKQKTLSCFIAFTRYSSATCHSECCTHYLSRAFIYSLEMTKNGHFRKWQTFTTTRCAPLPSTRCCRRDDDDAGATPAM